MQPLAGRPSCCTVWHGTVWHGAAWHGTTQPSRHSKAQHSKAQHSSNTPAINSKQQWVWECWLASSNGSPVQKGLISASVINQCTRRPFASPLEIQRLITLLLMKLGAGGEMEAEGRGGAKLGGPSTVHTPSPPHCPVPRDQPSSAQCCQPSCHHRCALPPRAGLHQEKSRANRMLLVWSTCLKIKGCG